MSIRSNLQATYVDLVQALKGKDLDLPRGLALATVWPRTGTEFSLGFCQLERSTLPLGGFVGVAGADHLASCLVS